MRNSIPSVTPGAIIGYRRNGTPIRLIAGGNGEGDDGGAGDGQDGAGTDPGGQQGSGEPGTGGQGTTGGQAQQGSGDAGTPPSGDGNAMRAVREELRAAKAAAREHKTALDKMAAENKRRDDETAARNLALARALGIATNEPPDPEKLAADLAAAREQTAAEAARAQQRERELTIELELLKQARRHGANPDALVDSRSFMSTLGRLDPSSADFATDLGDAIKSAVEANPGYKLEAAAAASTGTANASGSATDPAGTPATPPAPPAPAKGQGTTAPPARSGTGDGHNGAPGGQRQWTDEDVSRASPREVATAMEQGLLADLGFAKPKARR